jgi:hypothetical protein
MQFPNASARNGNGRPIIGIQLRRTGESLFEVGFGTELRVLVGSWTIRKVQRS